MSAINTLPALQAANDLNCVVDDGVSTGLVAAGNLGLSMRESLPNSVLNFDGVTNLPQVYVYPSLDIYGRLTIEQVYYTDILVGQSISNIYLPNFFNAQNANIVYVFRLSAKVSLGATGVNLGGVLANVFAPGGFTFADGLSNRQFTAPAAAGSTSRMELRVDNLSKVIEVY